MKTLIIISLLICSLFAQNYTKKEFAAKSIELGWNYETCAFGSSGRHINGQVAAINLATSRAAEKIIINNCSKKTETVISNNTTITKITTVVSSANFAYRPVLQGKIKSRYISAVCATKPIICTTY